VELAEPPLLALDLALTFKDISDNFNYSGRSYAQSQFDQIDRLLGIATPAVCICEQKSPPPPPQPQPRSFVPPTPENPGPVGPFANPYTQSNGILPGSN
jgi:hypothetical protein